MEQEEFDRYQLAGLDERERGFSRPVEFEQAGQPYRAVLKYEAARITTDLHSTQEAALLTLIRTLQSRGYRQLKTQMSFRRGGYLGSQEPWVEYPDAPPTWSHPRGLFARFLSRLRLPRRMKTP